MAGAAGIDGREAGVPHTVRPWSEVPAAALAGLHGVLTDIDDTLTREGAIEPPALAALHALAVAGLPVVAVTGRPLHWCKPFATAWPLRAIVAENGACAWVPDGRGGAEALFVQDAATRAANARRLEAVAARIEAEVPGAARAHDSAGRVTDIAIDHAEFHTLDEPRIAKVLALMRAAGLTATVSSIHVNGWVGTHDKKSGAAWIVRHLFDCDLEAERAHWLYVGDSTNDEVMFEAFPLAVGVANLRRFAAQLRRWPAYLAAGERGLGFAEVAAAVIAARA
jgi:HAD superfamily hydrolase (TIGR01484 family)